MTETDNELKLELVQVLFRHGARTPIQRSLKIYHFNNPSVYEPWGIGQLTNEGKQQAYKLGLFLRKRYNGHLNNVYQAKEVYAYTSDTSRSKMSLSLVLAGLYPPVGETIWNSSLMWSPIPYLSPPFELDYLLRGYETPKYMKALITVLESNEFQQEYAKYSDVLKMLKEKTELTEVSKSMLVVRDIMDVLFADESMKLPLPDWYTPEVKQAFLEILSLGYDSTVATLEMKKTLAGPIVNTFIKNMNLNGSVTNTKKIYLYSAHDANLSAFTRAHNILEFRNPNYGDAVIFEKLRDSKNQVYVRMLAWTGTDQLLTFKLGNHEELCPVEDYLKIVEPIILTEQEINNFLSGVDITKLKNAFFKDDIVTQWT